MCISCLITKITNIFDLKKHPKRGDIRKILDDSLLQLLGVVKQVKEILEMRGKLSLTGAQLPGTLSPHTESGRTSPGTQANPPDSPEAGYQVDSLIRLTPPFRSATKFIADRKRAYSQPQATRFWISYSYQESAWYLPSCFSHCMIDLMDAEVVM